MRWGVVLVLMMPALLAGPVAPAQSQALFSPHSFRNTPLPDNAPLDPLSASFVGDLARKADERGAVVNHAAYSTPVFTVTERHRERTVEVTDPDHRDCTVGNPCLVEQFRRVPLPKYPEAAPGSDGWMVVYQPSSDTMWEFWRFRMADTGPQAEYGGRIEHLSANPGHFTESPGTRFGATATSIPLLAGLQRIDELQAGTIDHVVSFAMHHPRRGWRWPAQRGDGWNLMTTVAPQGTCFRLPARLDLNSLGLTPYGLTLARAVQRYGMVMTDSTRVGVALFAEAGRKGSDPYTGDGGIFGGLPNHAGPDGVLRNFPWNRLQALASGAC